jgi:hypothetical protein
MPRLVIALIGLLAFAPSAHAANVTVTTAAGTAKPGMVSALIELLAEPGRVIIGDGCIAFGCPVPELRTEPGETVTIAVDGPVDELIARAGDATASPRDATTWTLTAPSVPAELNISIRETTATARTRSSSRLMLVGPPPPPPAEVVPTQTVTAALPPLPSVARKARLRGHRLTMTIVCPAAATSACRGTVTVRANGRTLARTTFAGVAPGARRTLKTTLRKRPRGPLRAVLTAPGAAPVTTRLALAAREPLLR